MAEANAPFQPASIPHPPPGLPDTYAWMIVVTPLVFGLLDFALDTAGLSGKLGTGTTSGYFGLLLFASWKDAKLIEGGMRNPRHLWLKRWIILTPVYLIQRARILSRGWMFLILFLASVVASVVLASPYLLSRDTYWGSGLPNCAEPYSEHMVLGILNDFFKKSFLTRNIEVRTLKDQRETALAEGKRTCQAAVTFSDGSAREYVYTIERNQKQVSYQVYNPPPAPRP